MIETKVDYYEILNVETDSSMDDIKRAYRKLVLQYHPDRNKSANAVETFKAITKAFNILSNSKLRIEYDISQGIETKNSVNIPVLKRFLTGLGKTVKGKISTINKRIVKDYNIDSFTLTLTFSELMGRLFHSNNDFVKQSAAEALIKKDKRIAYAILIRFLRIDTSINNSIFVVKIMSNYYGSRLLHDYDSFLYRDNTKIKISIMECIDEDFNSKGGELLNRFLDDKDDSIRLHALQVLNKHNTKLLLGKIYNLVNDVNTLIASEAKCILSVLKRDFIKK